jgi:hypothetical protein
VDYIALPDNPNLKEFSEVDGSQVVPDGRTKADGSFAVVAVFGSGLLGAEADDGDHYLAAMPDAT